jgi:hypothetical protein
MAKDRELVTPVIAIVSATLAVGVLASALVWRWSRGATDAAVAPVAPRTEERDALPVEPPPAGPVAPAATSSPAPSTPGAKPSIGVVTARVAGADRGIEVTLETALAVPVGLGPKQLVSIVVRCHVDGEWYEGFDSIFLDRAGTGDHVVTHRVRVGSRYQLAALPDACHVGSSTATVASAVSTRRGGSRRSAGTGPASSTVAARRARCASAASRCSRCATSASPPTTRACARRRRRRRPT